MGPCPARRNKQRNTYERQPARPPTRRRFFQPGGAPQGWGNQLSSSAVSPPCSSSCRLPSTYSSTCREGQATEQESMPGRSQAPAAVPPHPACATQQLPRPDCLPACLPARLTIFSKVGLECSSQNCKGSPSWALKVSCCPAARPHSTWKERQQVPKEHWLRAAAAGAKAGGQQERQHRQPQVESQAQLLTKCWGKHACVAAPTPAVCTPSPSPCPSLPLTLPRRPPACTARISAWPAPPSACPGAPPPCDCGLTPQSLAPTARTPGGSTQSCWPCQRAQPAPATSPAGGGAGRPGQA